MTAVTVGAVQDLPDLVTLEQCFPEQQRWSEESWLGELASPTKCVLISRDAAGEVAAAAAFSLQGDVVDLQRVVTLASARRQGRARGLILAGMAWARETAAERMLLEVEEEASPLTH